MELKSKCCGADVELKGRGDFEDNDEGCTMYYECKNCGMPCDTIEQEDLHGNPDNPIHRVVDMLLSKIEILQETKLEYDDQFEDLFAETHRRELKESQKEFREEIFKILGEK